MKPTQIQLNDKTRKVVVQFIDKELGEYVFEGTYDEYFKRLQPEKRELEKAEIEEP